MLVTKIVMSCVLIAVVSGGFAPTILPYKRYCSTALYEAIKLICGSKYNSMTTEYRIQSTQSPYVGDESYKHPESPVVSRLISDLMPDTYYRHHGAVYECCKRPCGYSELKKYCLPSD